MTQLATITLQNTSANAVPGGFVTPMFGHPFKKGHIPSGSYPLFSLGDGSACPYTMFSVTRWADGSLKFASFLLRVPGLVGASGTATVAVSSTSTAPALTSSRSLADFSSAGADLRVELVGADQLAGTWISSLNQGITDNDDVLLFGDGPVGKVWRVRQQFMQAGAAHGQLECYWYVAALQNAAGGLYGLRVLGRVSQPWYDVDTPTKSYRAFTAMLLKNGATTTLRDCVAKHTTAVTYPGSGSYLTAAAHGLGDLRMVRLTGTTLPAPLVAGTSYLVRNASTNNFSLQTLAGVDITLSGTASGDVQLQALAYIPQFSSVYTAGPAGTWDFVQAGGSAASDATVRLVHDKLYWMNTGVVPTYENITPTAQAAYTYEPNSMGPAVSAINGTGERRDIGVMPDWHVKHLLSQTAAAEQTVRITGLADGNHPIQCYNSSTKTVIPLNAGTYAGMPAANHDFRCSPANNAGFTPAASGPKTVGQDGNDFSHRPALSYYAYVLTGEPQLLDMLLETGWITVADEYTPMAIGDATGNSGRNVTINGTVYYGLVSMAGSLREAAWATRDAAVAAALCPDNAPQCASYKQYFTDIVTANYAAMANYMDNLAPAYQKATGFISFDHQFPFVDPWMHGYYMMATAMAASLTENANAFAHLNFLAKWPAYIYTKFGLHYVPAFEVMVRTSAAGGFITSDANMTFYGAGATWDSGTNVLTYQVPGTYNHYVPSNGDTIMWDGSGYNGGRPSSLSAVTPYYVVNASGLNFQLAATPGGAPLALGNTASGGFFYKAVTTPTGSIDFMTTESYTPNILGALKLAKAMGATVNTTMISDMEAQVAAVDFTTEPKYRFSGTQIATATPITPPQGPRMKRANRVAETTTSTSAASITLLGKATGRRSFAEGFTVGRTGIKVVMEDDAGNFMEGVYTLTATNTLTRTAILGSSTGGADVTFPAGTKQVYHDFMAEDFETVASSDTAAATAVTDVPNVALLVVDAGTVKQVPPSAIGTDVATGLPTATTFADADSVLVIQGGTLKLAAAAVMKAYYQAGAAMSVAPGQVTGLTAGAATDTTQVLNWTAPSTGTAPFTYKVERALAGSGTWTTVNASVSGTTYTVTGLTAATSYDYRVSATNSVTTGTPSATLTTSTAAAPTVVPGQVTGLAAGATTDTTQVLTWNAVSGATSYRVEKSLAGANTWTTAATPSSNSATVAGLAPSTNYDYRVFAVNGAGPSTTPSATVTKSTIATPVQTITVNTPTTQTVGTPFNASGTWTVTQPAALDYRLSDDAAGVWTPAPAGVVINANGTYSFPLTPSSASAGRTISVRDRTTLVAGTSGTYVVNAAAAQTQAQQYSNMPPYGTWQSTATRTAGQEYWSTSTGFFSVYIKDDAGTGYPANNTVKFFWYKAPTSDGVKPTDIPASLKPAANGGAWPSAVPYSVNGGVGAGNVPNSVKNASFTNQSTLPGLFSPESSIYGGGAVGDYWLVIAFPDGSFNLHPQKVAVS